MLRYLCCQVLWISFCISRAQFLFPFGFGMQIQAMFITALQETWSFLHFCTCVKCQPAKGTLEFIVSLTTDNILTFLGKFHSEKQQ